MKIGTALKHLRHPDLTVLTAEEVRRAQMALYEALLQVRQVCEQNGIRFLLAGGSALGAVRHGGFIPWDDDIDIVMERGDFARFREAMGRYEGGDIHLYCPGDQGYPFHFSRIVLLHTQYRTIQTVAMEQAGLAIDVCILESAFDHPASYALHGVAVSAMLLIISALRVRQCYAKMRRYFVHDHRLDRALQRRACLAKLFTFLSLERWLCVSQWVFGWCKNASSKRVTIPGGRGHYFKETYGREDLCAATLHPFEGAQWPIPKGYDAYMRRLYGDYMRIPKENERERRAVLAFELNQNDAAEEESGWQSGNRMGTCADVPPRLY